MHTIFIPHHIPIRMNRNFKSWCLCSEFYSIPRPSQSRLSALVTAVVYSIHSIGIRKWTGGLGLRFSSLLLNLRTFLTLFDIQPDMHLILNSTISNGTYRVWLWFHNHFYTVIFTWPWNDYVRTKNWAFNFPFGLFRSRSQYSSLTLLVLAILGSVLINLTICFILECSLERKRMQF